MFNFNLIENIKIKLNFFKRKNKKKVGVLEEGKNSLYINCEGSGPDGGLINKGENNKFIDSKWTASKI